MTKQDQMELELAGAASRPCPRTRKHRQQHARANWWFSQMRQVVDRAMEWKPAPRFQPEQIWFGHNLNHRNQTR